MTHAVIEFDLISGRCSFNKISDPKSIYQDEEDFELSDLTFCCFQHNLIIAEIWQNSEKCKMKLYLV
jgi:hypothetical protein